MLQNALNDSRGNKPKVVFGAHPALPKWEIEFLIYANFRIPNLSAHL